MRLALVSNDVGLLRVCQAVTSKLSLDPPLVLSGRATSNPPADVYLWDVDSQAEFSLPDPSLGLLDIFLVERSELNSFLERHPGLGSQVLLKPVSPAMLEVCLVHMALPLLKRSTAKSAKMQADRDILLDCLLQSRFKLQEYEQDRTNFWARVAHDLEAPVTAASGYCGLLLDKQAGPLTPLQMDLLQRIQQNLNRLQRMALAMLQVTAGWRLDGKYELKRTSMEELIHRAVEEVRPFAAEKDILVSVLLTPLNKPLYAEPNQIEQVLLNLLENACRFTPRHGQIEVRCYPVEWPAWNDRSTPQVETGLQKQNGHGSNPEDPGGGLKTTLPERQFSGCRVDVWDSGPGIPPNQLESIFEESASNAFPMDRSGGGLGLAICKMIVRAHRGEIWAESSAHSTTLSFVLPFNEPVTQQPLLPLS